MCIRDSLADDSGLLVDALDGAPGVYSSRYAGEDGNDQKNNAFLLENIAQVEPEDRTAHFSCVLCLDVYKRQLLNMACLIAIGVAFGFDNVAALVAAFSVAAIAVILSPTPPVSYTHLAC